MTTKKKKYEDMTSDELERELLLNKLKPESKSKQLAATLSALASAQSNPGLVAGGGDVSQRMTSLGAQGQMAVGQGAMQGAAVGSSVSSNLGAAGPWGAVAGAGLGVLQGQQRRKQAKRAIEAEKTSELGRIEKKKQEEISGVLGGIIANLRSAMLG